MLILNESRQVSFTPHEGAHLILLKDGEFQQFVKEMNQQRDVLVSPITTYRNAVRVINTAISHGYRINHSEQYSFMGEIRLTPTPEDSEPLDSIDMTKVSYVKEFRPFKKGDLILTTIRPGFFSLIEIIT